MSIKKTKLIQSTAINNLVCLQVRGNVEFCCGLTSLPEHSILWFGLIIEITVCHLTLTDWLACQQEHVRCAEVSHSLHTRAHTYTHLLTSSSAPCSLRCECGIQGHYRLKLTALPQRWANPYFGLMTLRVWHMGLWAVCMVPRGKWFALFRLMHQICNIRFFLLQAFFNSRWGFMLLKIQVLWGHKKETGGNKQIYFYILKAGKNMCTFAMPDNE